LLALLRIAYEGVSCPADAIGAEINKVSWLELHRIVFGPNEVACDLTCRSQQHDETSKQHSRQARGAGDALSVAESMAFSKRTTINRPAIIEAQLKAGVVEASRGKPQVSPLQFRQASTFS
jgi:hypothetical protein